MLEGWLQGWWIGPTICFRLKDLKKYVMNCDEIWGNCGSQRMEHKHFKDAGFSVPASKPISCLSSVFTWFKTKY